MDCINLPLFSKLFLDIGSIIARGVIQDIFKDFS